jgi:hypothetical protein
MMAKEMSDAASLALSQRFLQPGKQCRRPQRREDELKKNIHPRGAAAFLSWLSQGWPNLFLYSVE